MPPEFGIPALILLAKIIELTLSTVRTIFVVSGMSTRGAIVGFLEITFGVVAMGLVVGHLTNPLAIAGYAAGFSIGIIVGARVEEALALGYRIVLIVNIDATREASALLRELGYRVTRLPGAGRSGSVEVAFTLVHRRSVPRLMRTLHGLVPGAFVTVMRSERFAGGSLLDQHFALGLPIRLPWPRHPR
ncbi:MAG: DUF5698 domain-containing protein [Dehalococcoidia bacterium]